MKTVRRGVLAVACLIAAGCLAGCNPTKILEIQGVQSVSIAPLSAALTVGQTQQYTATVKPDRFTDDGVNWSVTPAGVATIDGRGVLTAVGPGQAVVKVTTVASPVHTAEAAVSVTASARQ